MSEKWVPRLVVVLLGVLGTLLEPLEGREALPSRDTTEPDVI